MTIINPEDPAPFLYSGGPLVWLKRLNPIVRVAIVVCIYLLSVGVLATYSAVVNAQTSQRLVGLVVSIAVVLFDLLWMFMAWQESYTHPVVEVMMVFLVRFAMSMFGPTLWFSGFCLVLLLLLIYNGYLVLNLQLPLEDELPNRRRQFVNVARRPELTAVLVLLLGIVGTVLVASLNTSEIPRNVITLGGANFSFWALALGSLLLAIVFITALVSYRIYMRRV